METSGNKVCDDAPKFLEFLYFQAVFLYFVKSVFPPNRVTRRRDIAQGERTTTPKMSNTRETSGHDVCVGAPRFLYFLYFQVVFLYFAKTVFPPNCVTC